MKIKGFIDDNLSPRIPFRSSDGVTIHLVVDTGFNGALCLPLKLIRELKFVEVGSYEIELADGSKIASTVYSGEIIWFQKKLEVLAHATQARDGLLGTELLRGAYLELDIEANYVMITKK